jgi:hypothetical protein
MRASGRRVCVCSVCVGQVSYHEAGPTRDDSNSLVTTATNVTLASLLPGRNYTVTVSALLFLV